MMTQMNGAETLHQNRHQMQVLGRSVIGTLLRRHRRLGVLELLAPVITTQIFVEHFF